MKKDKNKKTNKKQENSRMMQNIINALTIVIVLGEVFLFYVILRLNILPTKLLIPALLLTALVSLGMIMWLRKSKGNASKMIALVLSLVLILGATQISKIRSVIGKIAGAETEVHIINIVVMDDSPYKDINDIKDNNVILGANMAQDEDNIEKVKEEISKKEKFEIQTESYKTYNGLVGDLYDGTLEAIVISESHTSFLEESKPNFEEETRIIATYHIEVPVEKNEYNADVNKDTYSIFVSGIDTYGPINTVSRSDVNMVMTVNPQTHQILLTSMPRDYHVKLHSFGAYDKLTHAGNYGVRESVKTLEDLFTSQVSEDVQIDYYLRVNFTSVENIVNALGGVEVNSKRAFTAFNGMYFNEGTNYVNGKEALTFVRERKNLPDGDFGRIQNQQALITGVLNKAMSPAIITNYGSFLNSIGDGFELSMSDSDLNKVIKQQLDTMASWEIIQIQLKGYGTMSTSTYSMPGWNLYVADPDYETVRKAAEMILKMENGERVSLEDFQ